MYKSLKQFTDDYEKEIGRRKKTVSHCRVIEIQDVPSGKLSFLPAGSISVFVARHGSPNLEVLHSSLRGQDYNAFGAAVGEHLDRLGQLIRHRKPLYDGSVHNAPVLGEVSYHGKKLSSAFMVHDSLPVNYAFLPYSGGQLNHEAFQLTQYAKGSEQLESLVVLRKPHLTKVEQDILKQIPESEVTLQVGDPGKYGYCIIAATLTIMAVAATVVATYYVYQQMKEQQQKQQQQDQQAAQQDQQAAVQQDQQAAAAQQDQQAQQQQDQAQQDQAQQDQAQQDQAQQDQGQQDQGGQDQNQSGDSRFYRDLSELAYEFGANEINATASAVQLLALRVQYVQEFIG